MCFNGCEFRSAIKILNFAVSSQSPVGYTYHKPDKTYDLNPHVRLVVGKQHYRRCYQWAKRVRYPGFSSQPLRVSELDVTYKMHYKSIRCRFARKSVEQAF